MADFIVTSKAADMLIGEDGTAHLGDFVVGVCLGETDRSVRGTQSSHTSKATTNPWPCTPMTWIMYVWSRDGPLLRVPFGQVPRGVEFRGNMKLEVLCQCVHGLHVPDSRRKDIASSLHPSAKSCLSGPY